MYHLEQGESDSSAKQTAHDDRYSNNQNFQEEFPVDDAEVNDAAIKIQAQYRGFKTRQNLGKMKKDNDGISDSNQQEFDHGHAQSTTANDEYQKSSNAHSQQQQETKNNEGANDNLPVEEELTEEEKREQERAAISIQAQFRGYKVRKNFRDSSGNTNEKEQEVDNDDDKTPTQFTGDQHPREYLKSLGETITDKNDESDRPHLEREATQLSEDFAKHRRISGDSQEISFTEEDMSDPNLDKAATRIQASFRGYKTRKELGTPGSNPLTGHDQHNPSSNSSQTHDEDDNTHNKNILSPSAEGNKEPIGEEDDAAAAVKIQAAYRGYRVRKDLEK